MSNTGTWMQRVAQDWLVLELTHGSGTALGIAASAFLPAWEPLLTDDDPWVRALARLEYLPKLLVYLFEIFLWAEHFVRPAR